MCSIAQLRWRGTCFAGLLPSRASFPKQREEFVICDPATARSSRANNCKLVEGHLASKSAGLPAAGQHARCTFRASARARSRSSHHRLPGLMGRLRTTMIICGPVSTDFGSDSDVEVRHVRPKRGRQGLPALQILQGASSACLRLVSE